MLESTNIVRKYIGLLDALVHFPSPTAASERMFVFLVRPWYNYRAMALHHSQFVWYRRLFVVFSRYTFINTFLPIPTAIPTAINSEKPKSE
ncbi:hypothetical protein PINS_up013212 [Pythium insidiosum]|nr:hypothetical protein PINS_up013212 [Pythium insidiosum]